MPAIMEGQKTTGNKLTGLINLFNVNGFLQIFSYNQFDTNGEDSFSQPSVNRFSVSWPVYRAERTRYNVPPHSLRRCTRRWTAVAAPLARRDVPTTRKSLSASIAGKSRLNSRMFTDGNTVTAPQTGKAPSC